MTIEAPSVPRSDHIPFAHHLWRLLVGPSQAVTEPSARRQAQLLSTLIMGLVLSGLVVIIIYVAWVDPGYINPPIILIGFGGMALFYVMSRSQYYRVAAWLVIVFFSVMILAMRLIIPRYVTQYVTLSMLTYLLVPVLLASIFLTVRETLLVVMLDILGMVALPSMAPGFGLDFEQIMPPLSLFIMTSTLIVIAKRNRDLLEKDRQLTLQGANEALQQSLQRWRSLVENAPATIFLIDPDRIIQFINAKPAVAQEMVIGKSVYEFVPHNQHEALRTALDQVMERGEIASYELEGVAADGSSLGWYSTIAAPILQDGRVVGATFISTDITERRQAEEAIQRANTELEQRVADRTRELIELNEGLEIELRRREEAEDALRMTKAEIERQNARLEALYQIGQVVNSTLKMDEILERLIDEAMRVTHAAHGQVLLVDTTTGGFHRHALRGFSVEETARAHATPLPLQEGINGRTYQSHKLFCVDDVHKEPGYVGLIPTTCTEVAVPIIYNGQVVGNLDLQSPEIGAFRDADLDYLTAMADQAAIAIANARLYERAEGEIQERRHAEAELKRLATELKRSNDELQQFAYVASHDLQEPLRMVSSYMQLLERRYKGQLDTDADDFITFAVDGANRMKTLINDLLAYSRVGTHGKPFELEDCQDVLGQALINLQIALQESGATVTHDPLPSVMADEIQLVQLLQNLIGNAIKFRSQEPPRIHVAVEEHAREWQLSVRDNGIGIDPQYAERIFVIFQRLHNREQYPGTGIGLAICRKIVQHHGGRIWVESQVGQGATFYFTLPRVDKTEIAGQQKRD